MMCMGKGIMRVDSCWSLPAPRSFRAGRTWHLGHVDHSCCSTQVMLFNQMLQRGGLVGDSMNSSGYSAFGTHIYHPV
jgi:hypothetical protein